MFNYEFMRLAFIIGLMLGTIIPLVGQTCALKRISNFGDALSHTSLLGVALGLILGYSPLLIAIITCIFASLIIEFMRKKFNKYAEISIVIVMSSSISLAAIISSFTNSNNFSSYLFGSILLIKQSDIIITSIVFVVTLLFYFVFYHQIKYISYNETQANLDGVNVNFINISQMILTATVIAISAKIIGALMVSALMILPYAASLQIVKKYKDCMFISIIFSLLSIILGLTFSYYLDLQAGGCIVIVALIILIITMFLNKIFKFNK